MTHKRQISGDTVGSGNDFAGHGNKLGDLGFSIRDAADTVDALHLTNTLQTLGKRLRVDEAGSTNDGIQIRGKQATSEQDLFQVFRNPSNKTVLSLKNPSGATPFVHLDLDTEKAVFKELDLECRDLTVTGQVTALEVVDINASGDVTIGGTATITGAINDYFLGAACAKTLGTVVAESAGLVTGDQVHDAVELRQLLSKKVDDKAAYDYGAGVGQSYALNTLRYPSTKCMAELLADSHVDLDADIAANTAAIAAQEDAIADNTSKVGISTDQAAAIVLNTAKNSISQSQTDAIIANTAAIALNTDKVGISTDQAAAIVLNTAKNSISQSQTDAIIANTAAIALNTDKVGISTDQAAAIVLNTAKNSISQSQTDAIIANTAAIVLNTDKVGISTDQAAAIVLNTAKNSISQTQTDAIIANTAAIALNTDKVGISTDQAAAIVLNTAKNSISQTQTDAIIANTADIATNATAIALNTDKNSITQTQTDAIIANTADIAALGNASTKNITAGFIIADDDVTTALYVADNFQEIHNDVSNTELGYLNGVTSAIQTQLAGKQAIHNDVSNAELGYLNGVTSAIQTQLAGKQAIHNDVSNTELGYLNGVTSAIQTQFTGKEPLLTTAANLNVRTVTANQFFHTVTDGHPGGYGFYRFEGTTNTTDMNQSDGTAECVPWTVKYEDSTTFSFDGTNSKRIQVAATGFYEVSFTILMTTTQPRPGNTVRLHVGNDAGTTATPYVAMGYIRAAENHNEASWNLPTTLLYLTEDDWICVYGKYEGRGNTGGVFLLYDTANISTLLIKRVS